MTDRARRKSRILKLRLTESEHRACARKAADSHMSVSEFVRRAIEITPPLTVIPQPR